MGDQLNSELAKSDANAVRLIKAFAGKSQGSDGITHTGDITYTTYHSIAQSIEPEQLYTSLRAEFGEEIAMAKWESEDQKAGDEDRRVANQFAFLHLHPKEADEATI